MIPKTLSNPKVSGTRTKIAGTRITPTEEQKLRERAASARLSPSEYIHEVLLAALEEPTDTKVLIAYLELLTEDVARLETVVTYVVANLKVGNELTASTVEQLATAASKRKKGYAAARLEAAKLNAQNRKGPHD